MKYIKLFIITIFLFSIGIINCYAEEINNNLITNNTGNNQMTVSKDQKLFDFANLLNESEKKKIIKRINSYNKDTGIDAIILTTPKLDGKTISEYATLFYQKNSFKKNTLLFVIYVNDIEPEIYMYGIGKKTTKCYTDERIGDILEYVYNYIEKEKYYTAIDKYLVIIDGFYKADSSNYYLNSDGSIKKYIPWIEIVILSLAVAFIVIMVFVYRIISNNKIVKHNVLDDKLDGDSINVSTLKDELIDTTVSK